MISILPHQTRNAFELALAVRPNYDLRALIAYSGRIERPFRAKPITDSGRSRTPVPVKANTPERSDAGALYFAGFVPFVKPFRSDSPVSLIRCAPCTSRSQIASATVSSPMTGCQSLGSS